MNVVDEPLGQLPLERVRPSKDKLDFGWFKASEFSVTEVDGSTVISIDSNKQTYVLTGVTLGATVDRRWLALPGLVAAFLLQHGLQGWCPPLPAIRALGVRTPGEIEEERHALKAARGDYSRLGHNGARGARTLLEAASRRG